MSIKRGPVVLIHLMPRKWRQREAEGKERVEISRLRHQPSSYSPFCLLVLRLTLRIQTQGRNAEERESQGLYRQGCGGGRQETTASSCIAHWREGAAFEKKRKKREVPKTVVFSALTFICFVFQFEIFCV